MINNCAGGMTPWGTWLTCEENFNGYFWGKLADEPSGGQELQALRRPGTPAYAWGKFHDRFDIAKEPNEANRFGWMVEIDPVRSRSTPKKRTALGRFKHEGAAGIVNKDGRVRRLSSATTSASTMSTVRHRRHGRSRTTAPPTRTCSTRARSRSRASTPTARASGCRWCTARGR